MSLILTYTGVKFDLLNPQPEMIRAMDIAIALSRQARFNGHTSEFYSVAQHSAIMSQLCHLVPRAGLLHDAAEAYMGDMVRPLKNLIPRFSEIEDRIQRVVEQAFRLREGCLDHVQVKHNDLAILATERRDLLIESPIPWVDMPPPFSSPITPLGEEDAFEAFCDAFKTCFTCLPHEWDAWNAETTAALASERA